MEINDLKACIIDASVAVKWFKPGEPDARVALDLKERHALGHLRLIVPELFFLETLNALRYSKGYSGAACGQVLSLLWDLELERRGLDEMLLQKTGAIAYAYGVSVYDALYVAMAETEGFPLITADHALLKCLKGQKIALGLGQIVF